MKYVEHAPRVMHPPLYIPPMTTCPFGPFGQDTLLSLFKDLACPFVSFSLSSVPTHQIMWYKEQEKVTVGGRWCGCVGQTWQPM